ncbi:putative lipid-transfer protein DIR1 isoform X1 [Vigna umbellata]|uniref:putative lipid-transfer protein DIR1 isoform X1 n=2 Tax=Vigna umbellata TaxID=87088 RepID=UPI001F5EE8FB|nr:putative lipid-transfer protein DIR1 isoform X1 [Vigna umbellata]
MEDYKKGFCLLCVLVFVSISEIHRVEGAGECGRSTTPDNEALKLIPCASAAQDENAKVSQSCCAQVQKLGKNPSCLCAVMLSNTAKLSGADPKVAITIPKRCNLPNRPVGYKCGRKYISHLLLFWDLFEYS